MLGIALTTFARNKKIISQLAAEDRAEKIAASKRRGMILDPATVVPSIEYTRAGHKVYLQTLKEFGLKKISLKKFTNRMIFWEGLEGGYVDAQGNLTEELTDTRRMTNSYANKYPKYLEAMSRATGHEILTGTISQESTTLPIGSGWKGYFTFTDNGKKAQYAAYTY